MTDEYEDPYQDYNYEDYEETPPAPGDWVNDPAQIAIADTLMRNVLDSPESIQTWYQSYADQHPELRGLAPEQKPEPQRIHSADTRERAREFMRNSNEELKRQREGG